MLFTQDQIGGPLWAGVRHAFGAGGAVDDGVTGVETGVNGLSAQRPLEAAADNEHGGAVREGPEGEHDTGVLEGRPAEALGEPLAHEIERRPGLVQRGRLGHSIEKNFIGVAVMEREFEVALDGLAQGAGAAERGEKFGAGLQAQGFQNVVAVAVAFVDRRSGGAGGFGDGTHGEGLFAAAGPQARGRVENALFQAGIGLTGQCASRERE